MVTEDVERFGRERLDADRRYNQALTEFDRAVNWVATHATFERDQFDRLATSLVVFLQQITAFVDTKDREIASRMSSRLDQAEATLDSIGELRAQIGILQRAVQALTRNRRSEVADHVVAADPGCPADYKADYKYVAFEDQFRGSDTDIEDRLRAYVPIFSATSGVLDLGCGRGELLAALKAAGVSARGVDINADMVAIVRDRGLDAERGDALAYVESLADASLGGVIAAQLIEHLEPQYLLRLLDALSHKLQRGAPIVLETINPACWLAFFSSYLRDFTHVRPVHPETLQYLLRASGFERVETRFSAPVPEHMKMQAIHLPSEVLTATDAISSTLVSVAHAINTNAAILNNLMFTHLDYAAVGYRA